MRCLSTFRHRAVGRVLQRLRLGRGTHVYELSSRGALCHHLRRTFSRVTVSELFDGMEAGRFRDGVQCQDVQGLTYGDATFDLVTSTEVFEHVPDDRRAFAEIHRVLRPGGFLVFTVPLRRRHRHARTGPPARRCHRSPGRARVPRRPAARTRKVLAFRTYGRDILDRLRTAGFDAKIEYIDDDAHAIDDAAVVLGRKPA